MGIAEIPLRLEAAAAVLRGRTFGDGTCSAFSAAVRDEVRPNDDIHASSGYRRHLVGALAERALLTAWQKAAVKPA
jgi:carbon-monoxide dehydrogenase medium subunit